MPCEHYTSKAIKIHFGVLIKDSIAKDVYVINLATFLISHSVCKQLFIHDHECSVLTNMLLPAILSRDTVLKNI